MEKKSSQSDLQIVPNDPWKGQRYWWREVFCRYTLAHSHTPTGCQLRLWHRRNKRLVGGRRFRQNDDTQQRKCHSWYPELFLDYKPNIYLSKTLWMLDNNPVTLSGTGCHCFNKKEIRKYFYGKLIHLSFGKIKYKGLDAHRTLINQNNKT